MNHGAPQFPDALVEALRHERLVPFVGPRITQQARDLEGKPFLPDWHQLMLAAIEELTQNKRDNEARLLREMIHRRQPDWYQAVLTARTSMSGLAWQRFLYRNLQRSHGDLDLTSISTARAVWGLPQRIVVTIAIDRILTWSCPRANDLNHWFVTPPEYVEDLSQLPSTRSFLWHLHGHIDDPASIVLSPRGRMLHPDTGGSRHGYRAALSALQQLFASHTVLFLGFSDQDTYFIQLLRQVNELFNQCGGPHFALTTPKDAKLLANQIGDLPLSLIALPYSDEVALSVLAERANQPSQLTPSEEVTVAQGLMTQMPTVGVRPGTTQPQGEGVDLPIRYQIRSKLGQGGMGAVYQAYDRQLDRDVAIKVILPNLLGKAADQQFSVEARAIAKLDHHSIVPVYDYGRHNGTVFLTMPLIQGKLLRRLMREGELTLLQKLDICIQLAEALDYSHAQGVYHCDIKPENVMVRDHGEGYRVRVMDFGLAQLATRKRMLHRGDVVGTPAYLSPEQCQAMEVDGRADLYALGTILYEMLAGEPPFKGPFHSLIYKIVHERPPLLLSRGVEIDEELESLVLGCLAKKPENRPQRGQQLALALRNYMDRRTGRTSGVSHQPLMTSYLDGPPLVGREEEMNELYLRLDACLAGVCQFAVIGGESGMGKTRLMQELEHRALDNIEPFQVWWARFPELEETMPYQAFGELITHALKQRQERSLPMPDLGDLAPELVRFLPALTEVAAIREWTSLGSGGSVEGKDQRYVFDLMARTLRRLTTEKPTLLLLENLGAGGASLEALQYLVHRIGDTPTLIVGTYRGGLAQNQTLNRFLRSFQGDRRFLSLELGPLDETRHRRLVTSLLGGGETSPDLLDKLYEINEGNPYFIQELVRNLRDSNGIVLDDHNRWVLSDEASLHDDALPRTIQAAVEERLKHLDDHVRDTLATAAVLGRRFTYSDLEALDANPSSLDAVLDLLTYDGILAEDPRSRGTSFMFQSRVVRDVLYQRFSRRKRRELHHRYALYLERAYADKLDRVYALLVHHFAEGDEPDKTVHYAIEQARRSLEAFAPDEAIRCVQVALGFVRDESYKGGVLIEGRLCQLLSEAHLGMGNLELALSEAAEAVRAFKKGNDARGASNAALLAAETAWRLHKVEATRRWVENGIALARTTEDREVLHRLLTLAAKEANLSRNYSKARTFLAEVETLAPPARRETLSGPIPFGGKLKTAIIRHLITLQPGKIQRIEELEYSATVFEPLLQVDANGELTPVLAESWESHDQARRFTVHLRAAATFSDNEPLTAAQVKLSLEQAAKGMVGSTAPAFAAIRGMAAYRAGKSGEIEGIVVESTHRLSFVLEKPQPLFPVLLSDRANTAIFKIRQEEGRVMLIGTGPFTIGHLDAHGLQLVRNNRYWRKLLPSLEVIDCRFLENEQSMIDAMRTDQIDLGRDLSSTHIEAIVRIPRYQRGLVECTRRSVGFIVFNQESPLLCRPELRALLLGMVRVRELVWHTIGRCARPATCLIPPGLIGHDPARRGLSRNKGGEAHLISEWGLEPPLILRAVVHPFVNDTYGPMVQGLFREWLSLGVEVRVINANREFFTQTQGPPADIDLVIARHRGMIDDPDAYTYPFFHSKEGYYGRYCGSPQRDALLEEARASEKSDERNQLYRRLETQLLDDALVMPLFYDIDCRLASTRLKNVHLAPVAPFLNYQELGKVSTREPILPKGVVRVPIPTRIEHLDPAHMPSFEYAEVVPNIFETLTRVGEGAHLEPWLADYRSEDGGRRYHFELREHVYFHDGRSLTARDVRYSFERVLRESHAHCGLLLHIQGAAAFRDGKAREVAGLRLLSESKFQIDLDKPLSFFPGILSHPALAILPDGAAPIGELCTNYVGTGPFRLARFDRGNQVILLANNQYWHKGLPQCSQLEFHLGMSPTAVANAFREGQLSLAAGMLPSEAESLRSLGGFRQELSGAPGLSTYFLVFNTREGLFASREARRALIRSLDIAMTVRETLAGLCLEAGGFIPPGLAGREMRPRDFEQEEYQTLPPGVTLATAVHPHFFRQFAVFWERITESLSQMGISLRTEHRDVIPELAHLPRLDLVAYRWLADYPDADTFVKLLHSKDGLFGSMVGMPRIDMLIEKARIETDEALRGEIYAEIEELIAREALLLPLFHERNYRLARPELRGLNTRIGFPIVTYESLSIEDAEE